MENWPSIPFDCEVPLKYRWAAFKAILSRKIFKLVTYNATVSLLPLYHHLIHDGKDRSKVDTHREQFNECIAYLSADDKMTTYDPLAPDECLYSIWDIRLVAWMLRPNATDSGETIVFIIYLIINRLLNRTNCFLWSGRF